MDSFNKFFDQIDLYYRPDFSKYKEFNKHIYHYELQRLMMRLRQTTKLLEEINEDREKLEKYKQLEQDNFELRAKQDALIYLMRSAEEQLAEKHALRYFGRPRRTPLPKLTDESAYIPSDINIDIDTKTVQDEITRF